MVSQEINFAIDEYNPFIWVPDFNYVYNDSVFRDKISNQGEPFSEDGLKSGKFKAHPENDNILSGEGKILSLLFGKQTETKHKNSEENNIINGIQEKKESKEEDKKNIHFITTEYKNRGKAKKLFTKNKRKRPHSKKDSDNIKNKIKSHFLNFLISLANDITRNELKGKKDEKYFYNIEFKNKINFKAIYPIPYKDILTKYNISKNQGHRKNCKNYKVQKTTNEKKYNEICESFPSLKEFFEQKVSDIFKKYYCLNKKLNKSIEFEKFTFELSPETKTFYDLLKKNEENKDLFNKCKDKCIKNIDDLICKK